LPISWPWGNTVYVWSAYGISAFLIIASMVLAMRGQGQVRQTLAREWRLEALAKEQAQETQRRQQHTEQKPEVDDESGT
jgi:heme exporter protein D